LWFYRFAVPLLQQHENMYSEFLEPESPRNLEFKLAENTQRSNSQLATYKSVRLNVKFDS
jgi:hypothetical protein